ncbi:hypothetical protein ACFOOP_08690 [Marinicaulis aureus]|uniref:Uncharacterized protein n=1 Tax=Hyphococcus aureus TaxID=2666033 RepID=A0ABW1KR17_9PROT
MIGKAREHGALMRLLRIAREEHAALREDLVEISDARQAAELCLAQLEKDACADDRRAARRLKIAAMLATYEQAEEAARRKLRAASDSAQQLEKLVGSDHVATAPWTPMTGLLA